MKIHQAGSRHPGIPSGPSTVSTSVPHSLAAADHRTLLVVAALVIADPALAYIPLPQCGNLRCFSGTLLLIADASTLRGEPPITQLFPHALQHLPTLVRAKPACRSVSPTAPRRHGYPADTRTHARQAPPARRSDQVRSPTTPARPASLSQRQALTEVWPPSRARTTSSYYRRRHQPEPPIKAGRDEGLGLAFSALRLQALVADLGSA